jgi:hypothetical protein
VPGFLSSFCLFSACLLPVLCMFAARYLPTSSYLLLLLLFLAWSYLGLFHVFVCNT